MDAPTPHLVSCEWLEEHLANPNIRVVDIRGYVVTKQVAPGVEEAHYKGARDEYLQGHIPGAVYVDWTKDIIDPNDPTPVQIATPEAFAEAMAARGISNETHVIAVDHAGGQFATRLWWALRYYGHTHVSVLDGGYLRWNEAERPMEAGEVRVSRGCFTVRSDLSWRVTDEEVHALIGRQDAQIIDARDLGQYTGAKRRGSRGGHIPGAISVPRELFLGQGGGFKSIDEIESVIKEKNISRDKPIVAYCNGGVAATILLFSLHRLGFDKLANYDGSWNEWAEKPDLPVETS